MKHTKEQIKKAVMEALKSEQYYALFFGESESMGEWIVDQEDFEAVADLVAEKLGAEG